MCHIELFTVLFHVSSHSEMPQSQPDSVGAEVECDGGAENGNFPTSENFALQRQVTQCHTY